MIAIHFVRFANAWDEHYRNAVQIWGEPDFLHRRWDQRAQCEIAPEDLVIFAKGEHDQVPTPFNYDDSAYV